MAPRRLPKPTVVPEPSEQSAGLERDVASAIEHVLAAERRATASRIRLEETDETIRQQQRLRAGYYRESNEAQRAFANMRSKTNFEVGRLLDIGNVPLSRRLEIAVQLVYGQDGQAYPVALREGRRYLRTIDNEPFLALGYAFLSTGYWCGGRTIGPPSIEPASLSFCIELPVVVGGHKHVARIPVSRLAVPSDESYVCGTNAYIGSDDVAAGAVKHLSRVRSDSHDFAEAHQALTSARLSSDEISQILARVPS